MNDIEQRLGFDRIRQMIADQCSNALAVRMVDEMAFNADYRSLLDELQLVEEMRQIVLMENAFPVQDFIDLTPVLSHLRIQGTAIELADLFDLRVSLATIGDCLRFLTDDEQTRYPRLKELASGVEVDPALGKELAKLIDDHGNLYDHASPTLAQIRQTIARKSAEIDAQVNHALARAKREGWAPEGAEVTIRDGRPVIPLLTTHRRKIKGLIQDESATRLTAFVEPSEVVELGNDLRELEFDERHEIQRILVAFSDRLRPQLPLLEQAYHFLARVDFLRAKARVAVDLGAAVPLLVDDTRLEWFDARHPLLYLQKRDGVVPFSLSLSADKGRILIISGPNAGGKSVCLKAIGLIQYMLQCGMPVPLRPTSECGIFRAIFIDIGDQQSIDNDLSTYTSHLMNIKHLLSEADRATLFLMDELGGGTEPRSGCAIAEAVLEELYDRGSFGIVTTHFADLKLLADRFPAIINGAMLFDTEQMRPLYRLTIGHPGSSFAFEIAENIGFPKNILQNAASRVGGAMLNFEHQLQQLEVDKQEVARKQDELRVADEFLNEVTQKYQRLNESLERRRHDIISQARHEAQHILSEANRTVERTISDIKSARAEKEATQQAREHLREATEQIEQALKRDAARLPRTAPAPADTDEVPIAVGGIVKIGGQETYGQVVAIKGKKAVVESNSLRMTIPLDQLRGTAKQKLPTERHAGGSGRMASIYDDMNEKRAHFNPTLDLRGKRADEAVDLLHHFLDDALLLSEKEVRILHGKGYGILMSIIREQLQANRDVRSFRPERVEFGGEGITVVQLK